MRERSRSGAVTAFVFILAAAPAACGGSSPAAPSSDQLRIASVVPNVGPPDLPASIQVSGTGFQSGARVMVGGIAATIQSLSDRVIVATAAPHVED